MNNTVYHLVVFLTSLAAVVALLVTGHANPDLQPLLANLIGGAMGGSGVAAIGGAIATQPPQGK